jgi:hypothetical protein
MKTTLSLSLAFLTFLGVTRAATPDATPRPTVSRSAQPAAPETPTPGSIQDKMNRLILPEGRFRDNTIHEAVEFLRQKSVQLDTATADPAEKGVNIVLAPSEKTAETKIDLQMVNIPLCEALRYVAHLANLRVVVEPHAVVLLPQDSTKAASSGGESTSASWPTGGAVRLPKVQFHQATLNDAVEFIRIKSRMLDPEKKGLNIAIKPGGAPETKIDLRLENIPAWEALRYSAQLAGYTLSAGENMAVLTPVAR